MRDVEIAKWFSAAAFGLGVMLSSGVASAAHHQWFISEIYSNADGTIQFVELKGTANNEQFLNGFNVDTVDIANMDAIEQSVPLGPNLPSSTTAGAYLLIATQGYANLAALQGAPAPDRTMPANFMKIAGDTVRYAGIATTKRTYTAGQLPTNGTASLDFEHPGATTNTPQNFSGATGSIHAAGSVPALSRWAITFTIGALVLVAGLLLRRRTTQMVGT